MRSIYELYACVFKELEAIRAQYEKATARLYALDAQDEHLRQKRIENLQKQLEKIDEYREKVIYYKTMAEKHIVSKNILTITPRELNFNRLRNWSMMIDPDEADDPYAQRIYVQAMCNEMFLELKEKEFRHTLQNLKEGKLRADLEIRMAAEAEMQKLQAECRTVAEGEDFRLLAKAIKNAEAEANTPTSDIDIITEASEAKQTVNFGMVARPLPLLSEAKDSAKARLGELFDEETEAVLLPIGHALAEEAVIYMECTAAKVKKTYNGLQNYLLNIMTKDCIGARKICFIDALHFNSSALGPLKPLEGSAIEPIPRSREQAEDMLREIVSSFSDLDEMIGMFDSLAEYNKTATDKKLQRTVLVLIGYPTAFSAEAKEHIQRILLNYEHYGITPILVNTQYAMKMQLNQNDYPIEAAVNDFKLRMTQHADVLSQNGQAESAFRFFELRGMLSGELIERIKERMKKSSGLGNAYPSRVDLTVMPSYTRQNKSIILPYGVNNKDEVQTISFNEENFAAFLMGASGSGKSTLLHTLITGIVKNYHPDEVELWLADFKMAEFAQYIDPMPPHVKYILLDESQELVYDLLDKLTEKMMERQRFFMKNRSYKRVEDVPKETYMPIIFVVLDEFSIMSQAITESDSYRLKLQNLLAKGRALGIKFLFSSQTFVEGIRGLTPTAKAQIQSRIAMKNNKTEVSETLELSAEMKTDQVRNWIDALPPHYALYKYRDGDSVKIEKLHVMYFPGKPEEAFLPQKNLIEHVRATMKPVACYDSENINSYVDKKPVVVDGNSYTAFHMPSLRAVYESFRNENPEDVLPEDILLSFGNPRRMSTHMISCITPQTRENLLLIGRNTEQAQTASILLSVIRSCAFRGVQVQLWAFGKNRIYKAYKSLFAEAGAELVEGIDNVCGAISELKQAISERKTSRKMILLLGMERIVADFEFLDNKAPGGKLGTEDIGRISQKAEVKTEDEEAKRRYAMKWIKRKRELLAAYRAEGKSEEEIKALLVSDELSFRKECGMGIIATSRGAAEEEQPMSRAYNAKDDFVYILRQGSRLGCHFMLCLSVLSDLKPMGLAPSLFKYRMAFRLSVDDSRELFRSKIATQLPEHICQFDDSLDSYSFRPYLHPGLSWDGWFMDENGKVISPHDENQE